MLFKINLNKIVVEKIKILIADSSYLTRMGLSFLLSEDKGLELVAEVSNSNELLEKTKLHRPNLIIIDYSTPDFKIDNIQHLVKKYANVKILAITPALSRNIMVKAIELGVTSYLLKDCGKEEIMEAIYKTADGEKFFCGKILDNIINIDKDGGSVLSQVSCDGTNITDRELEIVKLIAEGYSNKEIADKLFLSAHTVTTHRKNIMSKLGVNNTAGLVLYAVRENIIAPNIFLFS